MKKLLIALLLAGTALAQGAEVKGSGKSVDVMKFDVRGIKLGMGQEEALKIVKEKFPDAALKEEVAYEESMTTVYGKKFVQAVRVKSGKDSEFLVIFAPNVLENKPKELIVGAVGLILAKGQDNLAKLQKSAVEKYDTPSVVKGSGDYYWCHLNDKKECDEMKPQLALEQDKENISLGLGNQALEKAIDAAAEKINQDSAGKIEL